MRPELTELKTLLWGKHVVHREDENRAFRRNLTDYVEGKGHKDPTFRIILSFSSEGGIAIPWGRILPERPGFGEWLHLRFHEGYLQDRGLARGHYLNFHTNIHQPNPFPKLSTEEVQAVTQAGREMIEVAERLLNYTREHPEGP